MQDLRAGRRFGIYHGRTVSQLYRSVWVLRRLHVTASGQGLNGVLNVPRAPDLGRHICHANGFRFRIWIIHLMTMGNPRQREKEGVSIQGRVVRDAHVGVLLLLVSRG
jgi:hypothetical protein